MNSVPHLHTQLHDMLIATSIAFKEAGIHYSLGYGTALGAVRDNDYIPWDLDVDLLVYWNQREQIVEALKRLPAPYRLAFREPGYQYEFARVVREDIPHEYLHIDLFPMAPTFNSPKLAALHLALLRKIAWVPWARKRAKDQLNDPRWIKRFRAIAVLAAVGWIPRPMISALFSQVAEIKRGRNHKVLNISGSYGRREIIPSPWFEQLESVTLRGTEMPAPHPSESYLRHMYGDFRNPPNAAVIKEQIDKFEVVYAPVLGSFTIAITNS